MILQGCLRQVIRSEESPGRRGSAQRQDFTLLEGNNIALLRVLTDRGTEYCGAREHHEYQLYLALEDIDHSRTKVRHPTNQRHLRAFPQTLQDEFYSTAFRKTLYTSLEQLQTDLDRWMDEYNRDRPHSGKYCFGKIPMQTFLDSRQLAWDKVLDQEAPPTAVAC